MAGYLKAGKLFDLMDQQIRNFEKPSDKHTTHSYLFAYEDLFSPLENKARNVLEIGVQHGGSILLWHNYFINATIHGIDISDPPKCLEGYERIKTYKGDAYDPKVMEEYFKDIKFDLIIDDGPHTLESMKFFAKFYSSLLTENGLLIIEDVQDIKWCQEIIESFPLDMQKDVKVNDLRKIKNRYDDILIVYKRV